MSLLKFKPFTGPGKFAFKDPDTAREFEGNSIAHVAEQVRGYRSQNGLEELDYLEFVIEHYLCKMPIHKGLCMPRGKLKRGVTATIRGGMYLLKTTLFKKFALQRVADERSAVCAQCPHNEFPDKGLFVKWSDNLAETFIGDRKSAHHDELGNCGVCTCPLRPKVWTAEPVHLPEDQIKKLPEFCWQLKELDDESAAHRK